MKLTSRSSYTNMPSFGSLPYELKLKIAENLVDIILELVRSDPSPITSEIHQMIRNLWVKLYVPWRKQQLLSLLEFAPEMREDLASYCTKWCNEAWAEPDNTGLNVRERRSYEFRKLVATELADAVSLKRGESR